MSTFSKEKVYHSELRKATEGSPLWICFEKPMSGKGHGHVKMVVDGDLEHEYDYEIESQTVKTQLVQLERGVFYNIEALGSKDDAYLVVRDESGELVARVDPRKPAAAADPVNRGADQRVQRKASEQRSQRGGGEQGAPAAAAEERPSLQRIVRGCLAVAHELEEEYEKQYGKPMSENARALAVHMSIEYLRGYRPLREPATKGK